MGSTIFNYRRMLLKISKSATKAHEKAMAIVNSGRKLTVEDRFFIAENYHPMAEHNVGVNGIFFTPMSIAREMQIELLNKAKKRVLDLCAGIGRIALQTWYNHITCGGDEGIDIVCIENNPEFVRVGQRILPEASWVKADAFDEKTYKNLGWFDEVISNPPYGIKANNSWLHKHPSQYMAAEIAMKIADHAVFILPQSDCPFRMSGVKFFQYRTVGKYERFKQDTDIIFEHNCGIDTSIFENDWQGTKILTEIVLVSKKPAVEIDEAA